MERLREGKSSLLDGGREVETGTAICGSPAAQDSAYSARWLKNRNDRLVTAGNYHLRVWQVDVGLPKLHAKSSSPCLWSSHRPLFQMLLPNLR